MTKRRRAGAARKVADSRFWGRPSPPSEPSLIRPTPDPGAVVRSLGATPLALDPSVAEHHLTAVYEEAVKAATALAAANGILAADTGDQD